MTNANENVYVASLDARIAHENQKATFCAASMRFLTDAKAYVGRDIVHAALAAAAVTPYFNSNQNASDKFCAKAINRSMIYLQFALDAAMPFIKVERAASVLETAISLHREGKTMTRADAQASCTSRSDDRYKVDADKRDLIAYCDNRIDAVARQSSMSLLALGALGIIREVSKDVFKLDDTNPLTTAILGKFE